ncbi:hypothetical protein TNCT_434701 [Trichonephila clavata]|uniref:Uncharacterized protein n=1 Tax=Trichonephila clavata TaxID=2740835 RepID=A0A8X6HUC9_TRICU|nr:hypothetical protein TNCT_434701 [Trichonephila clavata]
MFSQHNEYAAVAVAFIAAISGFCNRSLQSIRSTESSFSGRSNNSKEKPVIRRLNRKARATSLSEYKNLHSELQSTFTVQTEISSLERKEYEKRKNEKIYMYFLKMNSGFLCGLGCFKA